MNITDEFFGTMQFELYEEIRKRPFIRITIPFVIGIILSLIFDIHVIVSGVLFSLSLAGFIFLTIKNKFANNLLLGITINVIMLSSGLFIAKTHIESSKDTNLSNYKGYIIGKISEDPKSTEKTRVLKLDIQAIRNNNEWVSTSGKTLLYLEKTSESEALQIGDKIVFSPELSEVENNGNPEEFDYKQYLAYNLIYNSDYLKGDEWQLLSTNSDLNFRYKVLKYRQVLISKLEEVGISDDELSVISALALGYKDSLSDEIKHSYASSGAMHILAVSGLHVGIVYAIIILLLSFIRNKKLNWLKVSITISLIWFYAMLTGLSPSVSRAALMFSILALGKLQNRNTDSLNAIAVSAFILLLINPLNITNIGFQLSYIAVIGIILLYPKIYEMLSPKNRFIDKIWSLTAVSIAAQIATAPLGIYYFHQFSNFFLLANYMLIPLSTVAIWLCITLFAFSGFGVISTIIAKILIVVIKSMNFVSKGIESLPFSISEKLYINLPQLLFIYLAIILFSVFFFNSRKHKHIMLALVSLIFVAIFSLYNSIETQKQKLIIVYNINHITAINIIDGKDNILFANLDSTNNKDIEYTAKNNWLKKGLGEEKYISLASEKESILSNLANINNAAIFYKRKFIGFYDKTLYVIDDNFIPIVDSEYKKTKVNYLVLSNNPYIDLQDISRMFTYDKIIIDGSNSFYKIDEWLEENKELNLDIHNVKTDGAFVVSIR